MFWYQKPLQPLFINGVSNLLLVHRLSPLPDWLNALVNSFQSIQLTKRTSMTFGYINLLGVLLKKLSWGSWAVLRTRHRPIPNTAVTPLTQLEGKIQCLINTTGWMQPPDQEIWKELTARQLFTFFSLVSMRTDPLRAWVGCSLLLIQHHFPLSYSNHCNLQQQESEL